MCLLLPYNCWSFYFIFKELCAILYAENHPQKKKQKVAQPIYKEFKLENGTFSNTALGLMTVARK